MNYDVVATPNFAKELKKLSKKYPSLKLEFQLLVEELKSSPQSGTSLGQNCYKIRLAIRSKGKGKSGGARVLSYVVINENTVYLLSIFDKSEKESLSKKEISELLILLNK